MSDINVSTMFHVPADMQMRFDGDQYDSISMLQENSMNLSHSKGYTRVRKFSYTCEPEQELEVKKQINQYLKLKHNRNKPAKNVVSKIANNSISGSTTKPRSYISLEKKYKPEERREEAINKSINENRLSPIENKYETNQSKLFEVIIIY